MWDAIVFARIAPLYLAAFLNAVAVGGLVAFSKALSSNSPSIHHAFVGSIGWFGVGILFSAATIILQHLWRLYWGEIRDGDFVQTAIPVASIISFLLFLLGIWESVPLIRHLGF